MSILKKYVPKHSLTRLNVENVEEKIRQALRHRVERAYLFGSVAEGKFRAESDIDLILIKDTDLPFVSRGLEFADLFEIHPSIDILVYTQSEFDRQLAPPLLGFWRSVRKSMRQLL